MTQAMHPAAIEHLPPFITPPGETDVLFVFVAILVLLGVIGIGIFYFKLHALPEQMAHKGQKVQFQIVAVLGLLSLFTHNHAFWIAGLLLAVMPLPDFTSPLRSIANSLHRIAAAAPAGAAPAREPFPLDEPPAAAPHGTAAPHATEAPHAAEAPHATEPPRRDDLPTGQQGG